MWWTHSRQSKLDQLPSSPSTWDLSGVVAHVGSQKSYFNETYPDLQLEDCIARGHWTDFVPNEATTLQGMIVTAMDTGANRVGSPWSRYVNALIQVYIPAAWGNAPATVMDALSRLSVGPQGLPAFVHAFRQLHDLLETLGSPSPDATRTVDLISRLDQPTRHIISEYQAQLGHQNQQATFDDVCTRLLQFGPPTIAPSIIGAIDAQGEEDAIFALSSDRGRSGPGRANGRGAYRQSGQANRAPGASQAPSYPYRLRAGAKLCLSLAYSGACNNPDCRYLHSTTLVNEYLAQIQQEVTKLQAGAKQRDESAGTGPQHALRGAWQYRRRAGSEQPGHRPERGVPGSPAPPRLRTALDEASAPSHALRWDHTRSRNERQLPSS